MKSKPNHESSLSPRTCIETLESRVLLSSDLAASVTVVAPASHQVKPGQSIAVSLVVTNNGDAKVNGNLTTDLGISASADGSSPIPEGKVKKAIHLAPGGHATFRVSIKVPNGFVPGAYYALADIDPANALGDSNVVNNVAVSGNTFSVLSPYPNLLGTWSGVVIVKKGVGKGARGSQIDTFTTQNPATGAFTIVGTNLFIGAAPLSLAGTGTISTKGVFQDSGTDVPFDAVGAFSGKGRLVGNKLILTYRNAINSGTITLTRIS